MDEDRGDGCDAPNRGLGERTYQECRRLAARLMRRERQNHTLGATALVHEAVARLWHQASPPSEDSPVFYAAFGETMRYVLADHARARGRLKRANGRKRVTLSLLSSDEARGTEPEKEWDIEALDVALTRLAAADERAARMATMHIFAHAPSDVIAAHMGLARSTVQHELTHAKLWLAREVGRIGR